MTPVEAELVTLLQTEGIDAPLRERLAIFGAMLLETNRRMNLTGAESAAELLPHILDSLSVRPFVRDSLVDVGSGGGLPAIPLALATGVPVTLIEATAKKAKFLEATLDGLGLQGRVVSDRAENAARDPDLRERFATGTARAVARAPAVAELLLPFITIGGVAVLQRGALEGHERNAVTDAALMLGAVIEEEHPIAGERRLLILRKQKAMSHRFPRRNGIPQARPLCL